MAHAAELVSPPTSSAQGWRYETCTAARFTSPSNTLTDPRSPPRAVSRHRSGSCGSTLKTVPVMHGWLPSATSMTKAIQSSSRGLNAMPF